MKPQRPAVQPLTEDMNDRLERLAKEKGGRRLVRPDQDEKGASARPGRHCARQARPRQADTPRSRMKTVNLELPDYVWTDLKSALRASRTSVRHIRHGGDGRRRHRHRRARHDRRRTRIRGPRADIVKRLRADSSFKRFCWVVSATVLRRIQFEKTGEFSKPLSASSSCCRRPLRLS